MKVSAVTPPLTNRALWLRFWGWVIGVPLGMAVAAGIVWGVLLMTGGELIWQAVSEMGTAVFWIGAIVLMYPAMIWVWAGELRDGLRARAEWEAGR